MAYNHTVTLAFPLEEQEKLRYLIKKKSLTYAAELLGISPLTLRRIANGGVMQQATRQRIIERFDAAVKRGHLDVPTRCEVCEAELPAVENYTDAVDVCAACSLVEEAVQNYMRTKRGVVRMHRLVCQWRSEFYL